MRLRTEIFPSLPHSWGTDLRSVVLRSVVLRSVVLRSVVLRSVVRRASG
jgi:hypothetical protein